MFHLYRTSLVWGVAVVSCSILAAWTPAQASSVPESAYSHALGINPAFLDRSNLAVAHPARLAGISSGIEGFAINDQTTLLARGSFGSGAIGLHSGADDLVGALWAVGAERNRFGVAIHALHNRHETKSGNSSTKRREEYWEPSISYSRLGHDVGVDVTVSGRLPRHELSRDLGTAVPKLVFERNESIQPAISLRGHKGIGKNSSIRLAGSFASRIAKWETDADVSTVGLGENYGHEWFAGLAYGTSTATFDELYVSIGYEQLRPSVFEAGPGFGQVVRLEDYLFAVSGVAGLFGERLTGLLGLKWTLHEKTTIRNSSEVVTLIRREQLEGEFSWGLDYAYRNFQLTGSLKTDLQLGDPFVSIDAGVSL